MCPRCVQDVRKLCTRCARCVQDVCKVCSICVQDVCKVCSTYVQDVCICHVWYEPHAFRKYSTCWFLKKSEEPCRILKKFVHACIVNVIHAKVLPGSILYIEHWMKVKVNYECISRKHCSKFEKFEKVRTICSQHLWPGGVVVVVVVGGVVVVVVVVVGGVVVVVVVVVGGVVVVGWNCEIWLVLWNLVGWGESVVNVDFVSVFSSLLQQWKFVPYPHHFRVYFLWRMYLFPDPFGRHFLQRLQFHLHLLHLRCS